MGGLISINKKLDSMRFVQLDHRARRDVDSVVCIEGITVIKFTDGTFFSNCHHRMGEYAFTPSEWPWTKKLLAGLRALRVINTSDIKEHLEQCKRLEIKRTRHYARESLDRLAKDHGFKITEEQKKVLKYDEVDA